MSVDEWLEWSMSPEGEAERKARSEHIEKDTDRIVFCWNVMILFGIFRSTSEQAPFCLKMATRNRAWSP